jgi:hypothetical protein
MASGAIICETGKLILINAPPGILRFSWITLLGIKQANDPDLDSNNSDDYLNFMCRIKDICIFGNIFRKVLSCNALINFSHRTDREVSQYPTILADMK